MTRPYHSGLRDPRTGRGWRPPLAHGGHSFRIAAGRDLPGVYSCLLCHRTGPAWAPPLGPCTGRVRALRGEVVAP